MVEFVADEVCNPQLSLAVRLLLQMAMAEMDICRNHIVYGNGSLVKTWKLAL